MNTNGTAKVLKKQQAEYSPFKLINILHIINKIPLALQYLVVASIASFVTSHSSPFLSSCALPSSLHFICRTTDRSPQYTSLLTPLHPRELLPLPQLCFPSFPREEFSLLFQNSVHYKVPPKQAVDMNKHSANGK